jgi:tetratricopeptide (TPR) repeat protein
MELAHLALTDDDKLILVAILAAVMIFVVFFEIRYMRGKSREVRRSAQRKDEAFNSIHTTRSVINVMQRQGANTGSAEQLVNQAKAAMQRGDYDRCEALCQSARDHLTGSVVKKQDEVGPAQEPVVESERLEKIAESILSSKPSSSKADSYKGTKLQPDEDGNYLSAKFEISRAKAEIGRAVERGSETRAAQNYLTDAESAFVTGSYAKALSLALKARKATSQEAEAETIPLKAGDEPGEPEAEPTAEEMSSRTEDECPSCGAPIEPGDAFCHRCGTKYQKERVCKSCGTKPRPSDTFCRKCGSRVD